MALPDTGLTEEWLAEQTRAYLRAAKAPSTLRAYRFDWQHFSDWCVGRWTESLPVHPETVAPYLVALAETHRPATVTRRLTAIAKAHSAANQPNPATTDRAVVSETLKEIRRTLGTAQPGKTRCSPPTCPVTSLGAWIEDAGITHGALFREIDRHDRARSRALHRDSVGRFSRELWPGRGSIRSLLRGIRCGRGLPPRRHATEPSSSTSCARPDTARSRPFRDVRDAQIFRDAPASKLGL